MDKEEDQEYRIRRREGDASDHVDGFGHSNRMRWLFFAYLHETCLHKKD